MSFKRISFHCILNQQCLFWVNTIEPILTLRRFTFQTSLVTRIDNKGIYMTELRPRPVKPEREWASLSVCIDLSLLSHK